jgi:hypothetical protein
MSAQHQQQLGQDLEFHVYPLNGYNMQFHRKMVQNSAYVDELAAEITLKTTKL